MNATVKPAYIIPTPNPPGNLTNRFFSKTVITLQDRVLTVVNSNIKVFWETASVV
jgi:hypothetical protein